ncbi:coadhesin-like [Liolophura sinensis]|uniref:coadhesin-like n=1 Tax=Liolophura sinensis TaxID=3198878 RepID=UPI0031585D24
MLWREVACSNPSHVICKREQTMDGNWSVWEAWSACSVTCGSGNQVRQRECNSPAPSSGGQECQGDNSEKKACNPAECEVDGNWSLWEAWSDCSVTCGSGNQVRQRECNSPAPSGGGQECHGDNSETKACSLAECEVDGNWSVWEAWSDCSVTCGSGNQVRQRKCNSPAPSGGLQECPGENSEKKACSLADCEVDGNWSVWQAWSACSATCGAGNQVRKRECNSPAPSGGGQECRGDHSETQTCNLSECSVDGNWSVWKAWSPCSVTCGAGNQVRQRMCNNPAPSGGGQQCQGDTSQTQACQTSECIVDGKWSSWEAWSACSATCGTGDQARLRKCNNPAPSGGGQMCPGDKSEAQSCTVSECMVSVDGSWSNWEAWTACLVTCGTGRQTRMRKCDNPAPSGGGQECQGDISETQSCGLSECRVDGNWSIWESWSACSVTCGIGNQFRQRKCNNPAPSGGGQECSGDKTGIQSCRVAECADKPRLKEALFEIAAEGYGLQGCELVRLRRTSLVQCALDCVNTILCKSFNFEFGLSENMTRNHSCILNSATRFERPLDYVTMEGYQLYSLGPKF